MVCVVDVDCVAVGLVWGFVGFGGEFVGFGVVAFVRLVTVVGRVVVSVVGVAVVGGFLVFCVVVADDVLEDIGPENVK